MARTWLSASNTTGNLSASLVCREALVRPRLSALFIWGPWRFGAQKTASKSKLRRLCDRVGEENRGIVKSEKEACHEAALGAYLGGADFDIADLSLDNA